MNKLDDTSLCIFGTTNRHYCKLYRSALLWIQKISKLCDPYLGLGNDFLPRLIPSSYRQWYFDLILSQDDPVRWLFTSLNEKQYHVIYYVLSILKYNPNFSFVLNRNYVNGGSEYVSKKSIADTVWRFIPVQTIIMSGDYISWTILKNSPWVLEISAGVCLSSINSGNINVFREVLDSFLSSRKVRNGSDPYSFCSMIVFAIRCDKKAILDILLKMSGKEIWQEACKCLTESHTWERECKAFTYFIGHLNKEGVDCSFLYRKIRKLR